ncbi:hypothetical protein CCUS01_14379 [Colletotrichum cuscutae]|uniref:Uncharacterized protein n=1 Tax=Colletotrichum cuscutae TaxID=1209917 RepID=A0AAI9Y987_9PEZI|nr:hypothetical protein CCUS01_14379 [Colletotrichum cuscutae]
MISETMRPSCILCHVNGDQIPQPPPGAGGLRASVTPYSWRATSLFPLPTTSTYSEWCEGYFVWILRAAESSLNPTRPMRLGSTPKGRDKQTGVVKLALAYLALSASSRGAQLRRVALSTGVRHDTAGMAKPNMTSQLLIVGVSTIVRCPSSHSKLQRGGL